tara:strand:+ start:613 stop:1158 length:546 start_codon:yes stop_codon:yes gene_type:complete
MSKIETNTIDTVSGTTNLTIGSSNSSTVTFESGASTGHNYPAFYMKTTTLSISNSSLTKVPFNTATIDTDSATDTSNNRFTVPSGKGGKYLISYGIGAGADSHTNLYRIFTQLYKNGSNSNLLASVADPRNNYGFAFSVVASGVVDLSAGDYIEVYAYNSSGNTAGLNLDRTYFSGFRIGA